MPHFQQILILISSWQINLEEDENQQKIVSHVGHKKKWDM